MIIKSETMNCYFTCLSYSIPFTKYFCWTALDKILIFLYKHLKEYKKQISFTLESSVNKCKLDKHFKNTDIFQLTILQLMFCLLVREHTHLILVKFISFGLFKISDYPIDFFLFGQYLLIISVTSTEEKLISIIYL